MIVVMLAEGYFEKTLPAARSRFGSFAVLRLDGDIYQSTWEALENLYPFLNVGGYVIVDDYAGNVPTSFPCTITELKQVPARHLCKTCTDWPGCRAAVDDFRKKENIQSPIIPAHHLPGEFVRGVWFQKT